MWPGVGAINDLASESAGPLFALAAASPPGRMALFAIDPTTALSTGSIVLGFAATSLALADGLVFVAGDTTLAAYDAASCAAAGCGSATCAPVASVSTAGEVLQLVVAQGRLFVGGIDTVTAFAPAA